MVEFVAINFEKRQNLAMAQLRRSPHRRRGRRRRFTNENAFGDILRLVVDDEVKHRRAAPARPSLPDSPSRSLHRPFGELHGMPGPRRRRQS